MVKQNVAYLRVSTEEQAEKYGLDVQREKIIMHCESTGESIEKWYVDGGYSGSKLDRPAVQELLGDAEKGMVSKVFIYKLDRMSRDVIDTLTLLYRTLPKFGVKIISATESLKIETPMDKVVIGVNAIMNQYEREVIYMRTRAGMRERVKKGLWMGGGRVPWGYYYDRNDGILHPQPEQAEMVRKAYEMYVDGYSCDKISKILGFKGERIVSEILKRKSNIGIIQYKGEEYKGKHEPIVSEELFYKAQECMKRRHTNSHISNYHILTGLCYCGRCGARMRYHKWNGNPKLVCYSQFSGKEYMIKDTNCNNSKVIAARVEEEVEGCFKKFIINLQESKRSENKTEFIKTAIQRCNSKIKKLYSLYAENDSDNLLDVIREEENRLKELKKNLQSESEKESRNKSFDLSEIKRVSDMWDVLNNKDKNKVLKMCIEKIVIDADDIEVYFKI